MIETWKDIPGYEGLYKVSDFGAIWIVNSGQLKAQQTMKATTRQLPYKFLTLCKNGIRKSFVVQKLVMLAFHGPKPRNAVIMHLDDNPANNRLSNLKYGTQKENIQQCVRNGRKKIDISLLTKASHAKIHERRKRIKALNTITNEVKYFEGVRVAASSLGLDSSNISRVCKGKAKTDRIGIFQLHFAP